MTDTKSSIRFSDWRRLDDQHCFGRRLRRLGKGHQEHHH